MIPGDRLSAVPVVGRILRPDSKFKYRCPTEDWEHGGVALGNPHQGYFVHEWRLRYLNSAQARPRPPGLYLDVPSEPSIHSTLLMRTDNVTEVALSFDQNMRPVVAFVERGRAYLYWHDAAVAKRVKTPLGQVRSPRLALDDKRHTQTASSDILLFYLSDGYLCYRQQRDRYGIEYILKETTARKIGRVGMGSNMRVHIELVGIVMPDGPVFVAPGAEVESGDGYTTYTFRQNTEVHLAIPIQNADLLVVAGGGGGGQGGGWDQGGGGGGAGGFIEELGVSLQPGHYLIEVGSGGDGQSGSNGQNGGDSRAFHYNAIGGGGGARRPSNRTNYTGRSGGSGGGGARSGCGGEGVLWQGSPGHRGYAGCGGGGGGASPENESDPCHDQPDGGAGRQSLLTGAYYAGGGSSGMNEDYTHYSGGIGGGGSSGGDRDGAPYSGGGGAGGDRNTNRGGDGGSGIVVLRLPFDYHWLSGESQE